MSHSQARGASLVGGYKKHMLPLTIVFIVLLFVFARGNLYSFKLIGQAADAKLMTRRMNPCTGQLNSMQETSNIGYNFSPQVELYRNYSKFIHGWMNLWHVDLIAALSSLQSELCVRGGIGEIGTHHGKFFYAMAASALPEEPKVAMDLYDMQYRNEDKSGSGMGKIAALKQHGSALGYTESDIQVMSVDSTTLTVESFIAMSLPAFRIFSVDGGHSFETTMSDMRLASCIIHEKGVFVVDDIPNLDWLGVQDAVISFIRSNNHVAPFLLAHNKIYFTTAKSQPIFLNWLRNYPDARCTFKSKIHPSRYSVGGWEICVVGETPHHSTNY